MVDKLVEERTEAPSLGGDDLVMRLMYELHAHVPEEQRPLSMSDLSDEQAARARRAVHAVLAEWESAKGELRAAIAQKRVNELEAALTDLIDSCEQRRVEDFDPSSRVTVLETRTKDIVQFHEALDAARAALPTMLKGNGDGNES